MPNDLKLDKSSKEARCLVETALNADKKRLGMGIQGKLTKYQIFLISMACLFLVEIMGDARAQNATYSEFRTLLSEIKEAVTRENMALALQLISEASEMLQILEKRPVLDEEALRWDRAQLNLDRAESMQNQEQTSYFANESVNYWHEYIDWFSKLDESQLKIIHDNPNSFRIQAAVRQLGNAYMRRDNFGEYSIRDLFASYGDLPPRFLSSKSMNLWRSWLFRCPSWKQMNNPSLRKLKEKFASDQEFCIEDWEDFYGFLEEWIEKQDLTSSKKRKYERWKKDLGYALGHNE